MQLGFYYWNNAKAWMTSPLYQEWLQQWDRELIAKNCKILLLQDNFSGHIVPDGLQNIRVENFEANLTAHVQPMDQGIIRCFKAHYQASFIECAIGRYNAGVTSSEIYNINQLQAMRLTDTAWHEVDATTIQNCWRKSGILPNMPAPATVQPMIPISSLINPTAGQQDPIANAEKRVQSALDDLVSTGALQRDNRMNIEALLNPAAEAQNLDEMTDEEICQAVQDARKAEYEATDSGDHSDDEAPCPTRREVLQAVSVINSYVDNLDDAIARLMSILPDNSPADLDAD